jgi:hypothetical protein
LAKRCEGYGVALVLCASACAGATYTATLPPSEDAASPTDGSQDGAQDAGPTVDAPFDDRPAAVRLVAFVTSIGFSDVTTTAAADTKCQAEAAGRVPGKFVAWYSSILAAAPARLVDSRGQNVDGPWYRIDGRPIVATRAALLNTETVPLENPINVTAVGKPMTGAVLTGTHADGSMGAVCPGVTPPTTGVPTEVGRGWTDQSFFTAGCTNSLALYCFQVE